MFSFFKKRKIEIPIVSRYKRIVNMFSNVIALNMKRVYSSDMTVLTFVPLKKDIQSYTKLLETISRNLDNNTPIGEYNFSKELEEVSLSEFYIDSESYQLDPVIETERFIKASISFITIYESKEELAEKSFVIEKNLRLTYNVIVNLEFLAKLFNAVSSPIVNLKQ